MRMLGLRTPKKAMLYSHFQQYETGTVSKETLFLVVLDRKYDIQSLLIKLLLSKDCSCIHL